MTQFIPEGVWFLEQLNGCHDAFYYATSIAPRTLAMRNCVEILRSMTFKRGDKKIPGTGVDFAKGHDTRRCQDPPGRIPDDVRVSQIQGHMRIQLAELMYELWNMGFSEVQKRIDSGTLTTKEMIAAKFLQITATTGSYPHFQTILKTIGLTPPDNIKVQVNISLEDLVTQANAIETTAVVVSKEVSGLEENVQDESE